jgi:alpha-N-acetylglucosaminidase
MKRIYLFFMGLLLLSTFISCTSASHEFPKEKQSLDQLLLRISPNLQGKVIFEKIEPVGCATVFELETRDAKLIVRGNDLSSMTAGLSWYLKYYCNSGTYWGEHRNPVPAELPALPGKIRKESPYKYRYYMNYCVDAYSTRFWKWDRWEREIDWMALNGVNLPLVRVGEAGVIRNVLAHYGIKEQDQEQNTFIDERIELQQKIIKRMLELGIYPVLDGFKGYVPNEIRETVKTAQFVDGGIWQGTPKEPFIKLSDPFFKEFGKVFYEEQKKLFGDQTFIDADPIVEGSAPEGASFGDLGKQIQDLILEAYPGATWVLQGWQDNPRPELLDKANRDRVLILDLWGEGRPQWKRADRVDLYKQTPWVWNVLNNFGGNNGLFGNLELIFNQPAEARAGELGRKLCGLGTIMEAIENNPVVYHAVYESAWLDKAPDIDEWLKGYAKSRYGATSVYAEKAWSVMNKTAYHCTTDQQGPSENLMCARPGLDIKSVSTWGISALYYSPDSLLPAWDNMIKAVPELGNNEAFQYDLVDLTRQIISNYAYTLYPQIVNVYKRNEMKEFSELSKTFLDLFDDLNNVLKTKKEFLTGPWIANARAWGNSPQQQAEFEREVKMLITTWGERVLSEQGELHDYAFREWEGIMLDLYKNRWERYFKLLASSSDKEKGPVIDWFDSDYSWVTNNKQYSTEPVGNPVEACLSVYKKYRKQ